MPDSASPAQVHRYGEHPWRAFAYTGLFCLAIGVLITMLTGGSFWTNTAVSFCIGWSINLWFVLLGDVAARHMGHYAAPIAISAFGLCFGLVAAGLAIFGKPWFFFTSSYGTLLLGVFFGLVGFIIFSTRGRLIAARARLAEAEAETARQEKLLTQTELRLLQAQIEPHFLFNTLSNIAGLIHRDPNAAEQTLLNLTTLLRSSLNRTRAAATTLDEELQIARAYLEIHAIRMQGRLRYRIESDERVGACALPPLIVQPLIENAIKHGIDPTEAGGEVEVRVSASASHIEIAVSDTGKGIDADGPTTGSGTGLNNVRERLQALYGDRASLTLTQNEPHGMIATVIIPRETDPTA